MRIYKRGKTYWCEFEIDKKRYQYSCKTKDKEVAEEVASSIHADMIRNRFNIPTRNKAVYTFKESYKEYIANQNVSLATKELRIHMSKHFLPFFIDKNIADITVNDIETYQFRRKLETIAMPKNTDKREQDTSFRLINIEIATL